MVIKAAVGEGVEKRFHVAFRERTIPEVIAESGGMTRINPLPRWPATRSLPPSCMT